MISTIELNKKNGEKVIGRFEVLNLEHIDKIMELQKVVIEALDDKQLYAPSEKEEFAEYIRDIGKVVGVVEEESNELIAMGVYGKLGLKENNYGHDLEIKGDKLLEVGQIESTVVAPDYRGNALQKKICSILEEISRENNDSLLCATVSPYNKYSLNSFLDLGYEIKKEKLKYGVLKRYVVAKQL